MIATLTIGKRRAVSPSESGSTARILHVHAVGVTVPPWTCIEALSLPAVIDASDRGPDGTTRDAKHQPPRCSPTLVAEGRASDAGRQARPLWLRGKTCDRRSPLWSHGGNCVTPERRIVVRSDVGRLGHGSSSVSRLGVVDRS